MSPPAGDGAEEGEQWSEYDVPSPAPSGVGANGDDVPTEVSLDTAGGKRITTTAAVDGGTGENGRGGGAGGGGAAASESEMSDSPKKPAEPSSGGGGRGCGGGGDGANSDARENTMTTFAENLAGNLGLSGGGDDDHLDGAAVDACVDALVAETASAALVPHPPDRPNSRGTRPNSVQSNASVSREVNAQMGDLLGGLFEGEATHDSEPFVSADFTGGAGAGAGICAAAPHEHEPQLEAARKSARQKAANAKAKAEEAGLANARERRESEARRDAVAATAARHRREAAAVMIQSTWRGGVARAEVLDRWMAVYQAQRFWRGAVARRRVARVREQRARDVAAAAEEARDAAEVLAAVERQAAADLGTGTGTGTGTGEGGLHHHHHHHHAPSGERAETDPITAAARAARVNAAAQRGTNLGAPTPAAAGVGAMGSRFKKPPLAPRAVQLMFDMTPPSSRAGDGTPRSHHDEDDGDDRDDLSDDASTCGRRDADVLPEWAMPSKVRADERNADLFAEVDALLAGSRSSRTRVSDRLELKRTVEAMSTPRGAGAANDPGVSGVGAPSPSDVGGMVGGMAGMVGEFVDGGSGNVRGHHQAPPPPPPPQPQLPPHSAATFEAAYSVNSSFPTSSSATQHQHQHHRQQSPLHTPSPSPARPRQQHHHQQQQPPPQPQPSRQNVYSEAFAEAAAAAASSSTAAENEAMSHYAACLAAAMGPSADEGGDEGAGPAGAGAAAAASLGAGAAGANGDDSGARGGGRPPALKPVSSRNKVVGGGGGGSRPSSGGAGSVAGSRPASPVTPAGISAMSRAEAAELEEESRFAARLQRVDAQQRFATSRADTIVRRYAASPAPVADSPGSVVGGSVYSYGERGGGGAEFGAFDAFGGRSVTDVNHAVDPARVMGGSASGGGGKTQGERKPRAVKFIPAKKKAAALSPDRPTSLFGEPPTWSPSAAKVLALE